ncbi:MAG: hypothetical protein ACRDOF_03600 [Gaiellaceae bacterium]
MRRAEDPASQLISIVKPKSSRHREFVKTWRAQLPAMEIFRRLANSLIVATIVAPTAIAADPKPASRPPVVVEITDNGFHWLDAGIGAVAAVAVVLLVIGLTLSVRHTN